MTKHRRFAQKSKPKKKFAAASSKTSNLPSSLKSFTRHPTARLEEDDELLIDEMGSGMSGEDDEEVSDNAPDSGVQGDEEVEEEQVVDDDGDEDFEDADDGDEDEEVLNDDNDEEFETEGEDDDPQGLDDDEDGFVTEDEEEVPSPRDKRCLPAVPPLAPKKGKPTSQKPSRSLTGKNRQKKVLVTQPAREDPEDESEEIMESSVGAGLDTIDEDDGNEEWGTDDDSQEEDVEDEDDDDYVDTRPSRAPFEDQVSVRLSDEQDEASRICRAKVERIVEACRSTNRKFRDIEFDLLNDKHRTYHGLHPGDSDDESEKSDSESDSEASDTSKDSDEEGSSEDDDDDDDSSSKDEDSDDSSKDEDSEEESDDLPDVRRVTEIFDKPLFFADSPGSNDVVQGKLGDCWFLSGLAATATVPGLIERCCVARDEEVGVYGFIFQRDGRWVSVVIDDQLFWSLPKFEELSPEEQELYHDDREMYNAINRKTGKGLYMSQSGQAGETWVPLIEKAFAKLHGDYDSLDGGWPGDAIEDLTGGITTTIKSSDILDHDRFWNEELNLVNTHQRLFSVCFWLNTENPVVTASGLLPGHAYSVLRVKECRGKRFVVVRNPWGKYEWNGPWSDGSKEWTGEWLGVLKELDHNLGDDGVFVMEYKDFLEHWGTIQSTTLFDSSWVLSSHWLHVPSQSLVHPWTFGDTSFAFTLPKPCKVCIVLSQIDTRYFRLLEGNAKWNLEFTIYKRGDPECKGTSYSGQFFDRSVSCVLELDEGEYVVYPRPDRFDDKDSGFLEDVISMFDERKLSRVFTERTTSRALASNYDLDSKFHHIPQTLYEAIDDDLSEDDEDECLDEDGDEDEIVLEEDVFEHRTTISTITTQVVEETVTTNKTIPSRKTTSQAASQAIGKSSPMPTLPKAVTTALGVDAPLKGFILVYDSDKDQVGRPVRFGEWSEKEIEDDDEAVAEQEDCESTSDDEADATEDATTVDCESEGQFKCPLEKITGDDEDLKPLWLGLKVYMQFGDGADESPPVAIEGSVDVELEDLLSEGDPQ